MFIVYRCSVGARVRWRLLSVFFDGYQIAGNKKNRPSSPLVRFRYARVEENKDYGHIL